MEIALNKVHYPVTALGFGQRIGIWVQGCSIHCPGCVSKDTWNAAPRHLTTVDDLLRTCAPWLQEADGISISGGEPFDQPEALRVLVTELRERTTGDILVFSGYPGQRVFEHHGDIVDLVDVLIPEPYRADAGQTLTLRGSDNQRIYLLSDLARTRYPADMNERPWDPRRRMDVMLEGDDVWMAGIPAPGDMPRLREKLRQLGYECQTSDELPVPIRA